MRLNYQHLLYFWTVVRAGGLTRASEELRLSAPTISTQLKLLEERLGEKLLTKSGRRLVPTETGRMVFRYADEIFGLGRELVDTLRGRPTGRPLRLVIGIDDVLPKEIAHRLIEPALQLDTAVRIVCREASLSRLVAALASHDVDVVLSDAQATPSLNVRAYNHPLGECGLVWMGSAALCKEYRAAFPRSLDGAPVLLPTDDTAIRRSLDQWFEKSGVAPLVVGEFEDYALLREFGRAGRGLFPVPMVLESHFRREFRVGRVGRTGDVRNHFYAISVERRIKNPAVIAICDSARRELFA
jgi:LysR family transcriptional regulator, transcriptional activator of nhaA